MAYEPYPRPRAHALYKVSVRQARVATYYQLQIKTASTNQLLLSVNQIESKALIVYLKLNSGEAKKDLLALLNKVDKLTSLFLNIKEVTGSWSNNFFK